MRVKRFGMLSLLILLGAGSIRAQDKGFGAGIMAGSPTGLNGKLWVSQENAVDIGLAWSFADEGYLHIHGDYLWHFPHVIESSQPLLLYAGLGGRLGLGDDARIGVRIPGGIEWWPRSTPLDVFLELAPILDLTPKTEFSFNGVVGVRFFFD
jgi:hypothetical protein